MCLAVPVRVIELLPEGKAKVEMNNVHLNVSTQLFPQTEVGDYVLIHAGFIIEKINQKQAEETLAILDNFKKMVSQNEG